MEEGYKNIEEQKEMASEPAAVFPNTSYHDVMAYLHTLNISNEDKRRVANRLIVEISEPSIAKIYERLDYLATLEPGWGGDGSLSISGRVLDNIRQVLLISKNSDWENWLIGPDTNATVGLQSKVTHAAISLGTNEYSYYAENKGNELHGNHLKFTPDSFLETMQLIG